MEKKYNQIKGLDYFYTYSTVSKMIIVRLVISFSFIHNWHIHQFDVDNVFFHQEDVYMTLPPCLTASKPNQVRKLIKSLYDLKQTCIIWHEKLTSLFIQHNYHQAIFDHSLFIKHTPQSFTLQLVYVDDVILDGNSLFEFDNIKLFLYKFLNIKNLG